MTTLTKRQEQILKFIAKHIDRYGFQPSFREIGEQFEIGSPHGVTCHLESMERKGFLKRNAATARAISFDWKNYL